jgi:F-type H+-transporting ATPase subunit a
MTPRHWSRIAGASCLMALWSAPAAFAEEGPGGPPPGTWLNWLFSLRVTGHPLVSNEAGLAFAWSLVAVLILTVLAVVGTRRLSLRPSRLQMLLEMLVGGLRGVMAGVMGPRAVEFVPFVGALFIYIALMNLLGMIPGFIAPTANLSTTAALALVVFLVVQYQGVREQGAGYLKHFVAGVPLQFPLILMAPLVLFVHLMGEVMRPVTLALRLFGNIRGEETVVLSLIALVAPLAKRLIVIPIQLPNMLLGLLTGLVQAVIFAMLATVYLAGVLREEHKEAG